jgi:3-polyprenyl-4-hydroxybenzoate decarboxylase
MQQQRLLIGVSGSSARHPGRATLKDLHQHPQLVAHLVVSKGATKTLQLERGARMTS